MVFFKNIVEIKVIRYLSVFIILSCFGCSVATHQQDLQSTQEREMTLGIVQKDLKVGMSQADVAEALGSPNIVTKDKEGKETWIYDKVAKEVSYSESQGQITIILAGASKSSGAVSSSQKTLTVVIRFDNNSNVESFSYHASKF